MLTGRRAERGFTIIEIATALLLLAILMTLALPQYFTYMQNQQIRGYAEGVQAGLQLARAEAVSRNVTGGAWFTLAADNSWTVQANNPLTGGVDTLRSQSGKERTANATPTVTPAVTTVTFNGLGRLASPALAANTRLWIDVRNPTGGACMEDDATSSMRCLAITVSQSGQIRTCDPARDKTGAAATDSLACQDKRP
jgi:type IV fimbrial biogenesis protein FimT